MSAVSGRIDKWAKENSANVESLNNLLGSARHSKEDIAVSLQEDVCVTRADLNAVKAKVRYRLKKVRTKAGPSGRD